MDETCEKCGAKQMSVKTMQLRSAGALPSLKSQQSCRLTVVYVPQTKEVRPAGFSLPVPDFLLTLPSYSNCLLFLRQMRLPDPPQQLGRPLHPATPAFHAGRSRRLPTLAPRSGRHAASCCIQYLHRRSRSLKACRP